MTPIHLNGDHNNTNNINNNMSKDSESVSPTSSQVSPGGSRILRRKDSKSKSDPLINPFLKHDGKNASTDTDCPKAHGLKLFVSPVGKPCVICKMQMPNGDRAWRCFPCDFHMCIKCHDNGGKYDPSRQDLVEKQKTGFHNPGWDGTAMDPFGEIEKKAIDDLKHLLTKYLTKEHGNRLVITKCETVIPDYSNRGHTGLSLEHCHKIAQSMAKGFRVREETKENDDHSGYDIPVLVKESSQSEGGQEALRNWVGVVKENSGFPEPRVEAFRKKNPHDINCSLGNGHFYQALNLFRLTKPSIFDKTMDGCQTFVDSYDLKQPPMCNDQNLLDAVNNGVPALILENSIPLKERTQLCELLNKLSDYRWTITRKKTNIYDPSDPGVLEVDLDSLKQVDVKQSQFELMSKAMDGTELNCLVRLDTNQDKSGRVGR